MSVVESIIWHVLGYAAIPVLVIGGFVAVALVSLILLSFIEVSDDKPSSGGD